MVLQDFQLIVGCGWKRKLDSGDMAHEASKQKPVNYWNSKVSQTVSSIAGFVEMKPFNAPESQMWHQNTLLFGVVYCYHWRPAGRVGSSTTPRSKHQQLDDAWDLAPLKMGYLGRSSDCWMFTFLRSLSNVGKWLLSKYDNMMCSSRQLGTERERERERLLGNAFVMLLIPQLQSVQSLDESFTDFPIRQRSCLAWHQGNCKPRKEWHQGPRVVEFWVTIPQKDPKGIDRWWTSDIHGIKQKGECSISFW